ncbi:hypothetical protein, variant [Fonticula alba]|uniref:CID domain-containing protein n=1 Tax=Fonticula alba TaxID=691883 RepID=A0A058ZBS3_FONAL|nr:hypothetical protein, variant [Fonticula alba]KCV71875.1 hypothetical protein, variant [Fonticula alba]|eukprot:XP_009493452.1 hypothetical protein, variant [Fonticula alba]
MASPSAPAAASSGTAPGPAPGPASTSGLQPAASPDARAAADQHLAGRLHGNAEALATARSYIARLWAELTFNSLDSIQSLTREARQHALVWNRALGVVEAVAEYTLARSHDPRTRIAALYLMDSICKVVSGPYGSLFERGVFDRFCQVYNLCSNDPPMNDRRALVKLFNTWCTYRVFSLQTLNQLQGFLQQVRAPPPAPSSGAAAGGQAGQRPAGQRPAGQRSASARASPAPPAGGPASSRPSRGPASGPAPAAIPLAPATAPPSGHFAAPYSHDESLPTAPPPPVPSHYAASGGYSGNYSGAYGSQAPAAPYAGAYGTTPAPVGHFVPAPVAAPPPVVAPTDGHGPHGRFEQHRPVAPVAIGGITLPPSTGVFLPVAPQSPATSTAVPAIGLHTSDISRHQPGAFLFIYDELSQQCRQCARRFALNPAGNSLLEQHMDLHFQQNQREAAAQEAGPEGGGTFHTRAPMRGWLMPPSDWTTFTMNARVNVDEPSESRDTEANTGPDADERADKRRHIVKVRPGVTNDRTCAGCADRLTKAYDLELEEWVYVDTIQLDGVNYHASCADSGLGASAKRPPSPTGSAPHGHSQDGALKRQKH